MNDLLLAELNEPQAEAVKHHENPLLIFAGAGSGKTRVIVYRIAALVSIHRVPPHRVMAVTFTNKAANEMVERLTTILGEEIVNDLWVGTFHALCARMLRRHAEAAGLKPSFAVYDDDDQRKVATRVGQEMGLDEPRKATKDLLRHVSALKQEGKLPADAENPTLRTFYAGYEAAMLAANAVDFDDILTRVVRLLEDPDSAAGRSLALHFRHVLVDEFQDANPIQYRLVRALARDERNLCVVGDDDQCHPPGTLIQTSATEETPVELLVSGGSIPSWSKTDESLTSGRTVHVARRMYEGYVYNVTVGDRSVPATPNHRFIVRWSYDVVYLVVLFWSAERGFWINTCHLFGAKGPFRVERLAREQGADRAWVMVACENDEEDREVKSSVDLEEAHRLLALGGMRFDLPFYPWPRAHEDASFEVYACNLLPAMRLPLPDAPHTWAKIDRITKAPYRGFVYSLDVAEDHAYVANGIVVLNSIYTWRGADVRIVRGFRDDFPEATVIKLEQNYRSRGNVVNAALGVIRHAQEREPKELWTANESGDPARCIACESDRDEANFVLACIRKTLGEGVPPNDIAVFYRTHAQSRLLEEVLLAQKIPYRLTGGVRFFERAEVKDLLAYLRLAMNPTSDVDFLRIVNTPSRSIGPSLLEKLEERTKASGVSFLGGLYDLSQRVAPKARDALLSFYEIMLDLQHEMRLKAPSELLAYAMQRTGYEAMLQEDPASEARLGNLKDLGASMRAYEVDCVRRKEPPTLASFLERTSLAGAEEQGDISGVALMTVHMAKGLEFDTVFITGMEEDLFPHRKGGEEGTCDLEEERRLAYVAITRARRRLFLTFADRRLHYGKLKYSAPSCFLSDLPPAFVVRSETRARAAANGRGQLATVPRSTGAHHARPDSPSAALRARLTLETVVTHPTFGRGTVLKDEADDGTVIVDFGGSAPKMLRASYLTKAET